MTEGDSRPTPRPGDCPVCGERIIREYGATGGTTLGAIDVVALPVECPNGHRPQTTDWGEAVERLRAAPRRTYPSRDEIWAQYTAGPAPASMAFDLHVRRDGTGEVEIGDMVVFEAEGLPTESPNAARGALSRAFATRLRAVLMDEVTVPW